MNECVNNYTRAKSKITLINEENNYIREKREKRERETERDRMRESERNNERERES